MKNHWHEQIQRYVNGQSSAEETNVLQAALGEDAEFRALYLDYMNLDVALSAAAELAAIVESGAVGMTPLPQPPVQSSPLRYGRWVAVAAACAALVLLAVLPAHRRPAPAHPDMAAAISSTQIAIARLSVEPASPFPSWMSPTGSLLDQP